MTFIESLTPVLVRSIMRYISGALVSFGIVGDEQLLTDVQSVVVLLVAAGLGAAAEIWRARTTAVIVK